MKIVYSGISLISIAAVGLVFAEVMKIATGEPVYYLVRLVAIGCLAVGGPVLGWGIYRQKVVHEQEEMGDLEQ